ncbi:MAG: hypothetical protein M5U34_40700 [Chloroflexi bacterium]|nr:hypothetical protein [Chloroflexota bacterium]
MATSVHYSGLPATDHKIVFEENVNAAKTRRIKIRYFNKRLAFLVIAFSNFTVTHVTGQEKNGLSESQDLFLPMIYKNYDATLGTPLFGGTNVWQYL